MHDGWRQVDRGGPFQRLLAGMVILLLAVPLFLLFIIVLLVLFALGLASALVSWVLGGRKARSGSREPAGSPDDGRENVRVIPPGE